MSNSQFLGRVLTVAAVAVALAIFWLARDVFVSAFFAVIVAAGLAIPARWLEARGTRHGLALALSIILVTLVVLALLLTILPTIVAQLGELLLSLGRFAGTLLDRYEKVRAGVLQPLLPDLATSEALDAVEGALEADAGQRMQDWLFSGLLLPALGGLGSAVSLLFNFGLLWLIAIWLAVDPGTHLTGLLYLFPRGRHARVREIWSTLGETLSTWLRAQFISIAITAALVVVVLGLLLRMPYTVVVAVFAGIATFIPNIGAFLPLIPITVFGLASDTPEKLLLWIPAYLVIQLAESNFITPSVVKVELEIPAGALMIFQLLATVLFGPLGLLLAVPIFAVIIVLVREFFSYDVLGLAPEATVSSDQVLPVGPSAGATS